MHQSGRLIYLGHECFIIVHTSSRLMSTKNLHRTVNPGRSVAPPPSSFSQMDFQSFCLYSLEKQNKFELSDAWKIKHVCLNITSMNIHFLVLFMPFLDASSRHFLFCLHDVKNKTWWHHKTRSLQTGVLRGPLSINLMKV